MLQMSVKRHEPMRGASARAPLAFFLQKLRGRPGQTLTRRAGSPTLGRQWPLAPALALQRGVSGIPHIFRSSVSRRARRWLAEKRARHAA
jgi:hypothetical protein